MQPLKGALLALVCTGVICASGHVLVCNSPWLSGRGGGGEREVEVDGGAWVLGPVGTPVRRTGDGKAPSGRPLGRDREGRRVQWGRSPCVFCHPAGRPGGDTHCRMPWLGPFCFPHPAFGVQHHECHTCHAPAFIAISRRAGRGGASRGLCRCKARTRREASAGPCQCCQPLVHVESPPRDGTLMRTRRAGLWPWVRPACQRQHHPVESG